MSKAMEFFKILSADSALKAAVKAAIEKAGSKDEEVQAVAKIARDAGFDVSAEELKAVVVSTLRQAGELSDSDLEKVAGGAKSKNYPTFEGAGENLGREVDNTIGDVVSVFSGW